MCGALGDLLAVYGSRGGVAGGTGPAPCPTPVRPVCTGAYVLPDLSVHTWWDLGQELRQKEKTSLVLRISDHEVYSRGMPMGVLPMGLPPQYPPLSCPTTNNCSHQCPPGRSNMKHNSMRASLSLTPDQNGDRLPATVISAPE